MVAVGLTKNILLTFFPLKQIILKGYFCWLFLWLKLSMSSPGKCLEGGSCLSDFQLLSEGCVLNHQGVLELQIRVSFSLISLMRSLTSEGLVLFFWHAVVLGFLGNFKLQKCEWSQSWTDSVCTWSPSPDLLTHNPIQVCKYFHWNWLGYLYM